MIRLLRALFCRHEWEQRYWGVTEHAVLCSRCGAIRYRRGPGGPMPEGTSRAPDSDGASLK